MHISKIHRGIRPPADTDGVFESMDACKTTAMSVHLPVRAVLPGSVWLCAAVFCTGMQGELVNTLTADNSSSPAAWWRIDGVRLGLVVL